MDKKRRPLSNREKTLILYASLFLVIVGAAYFIILPTDRALVEARAELDAVTLQAAVFLPQLEQAERILPEVEGLRERLDYYRDRYSIFANPEGLEADFTHSLISLGMSPVGVRLANVPDVADGLHAFTAQIEATSRALSNVLLFSDHLNSIYSYRLVFMRISGLDGREIRANFTVEARLLGSE